MKFLGAGQNDGNVDNEVNKSVKGTKFLRDV
jgi:hypothetical protein